MAGPLVARIRVGAELLDTQRPGWEHELALDRLDLSDCQECVLGQLYGSYSSGKDALDLAYGYKHGFTIEGVHYSRVAKWSSLTLAWQRFVARRLIKKLVERFVKP